MKFKVLIAVFTVVVISVLAIGTVFAEWAAMSSGYAVTTEWHGVDVPSGESVTAWAGTTDSSVTKVRFVWLDPSKNEVGDPETVFISPSYTTPNVYPGAIPEIVNWANNHPGVAIYYAKSTPIVPDLPGDWTVKAYFLRPGADPPPAEERVQTRATSFNAVPEIPLGTIGASAIIVVALAWFVVKQKRTATTEKK